MAGVIGEVGIFEENEEDWASYAERVQLFFDANEVIVARRVSGFLSMIGSKTYAVLKSLTAPARPQDRTLGELVTLLQNHFTPAPLVIAERYRFHKRMQADGETISQYSVVLRGLTRNCQFENTLNERLRDQLVLGLRSTSIQRKLLAENDLTLDRALAIANSMELAAKDCEELSRGSDSLKGSTASDVYVFNSKPKNSGSKWCFRCGSVFHLANACKHKDTVCLNCHKRGHLQSVCRGQRSSHDPGSSSRPSSSGSGVVRKHGDVNNSRTSRVKAIDTENDSELYPDDLADCLSHMYALQEKGADVIWVTVNINGSDMQFELDTGSRHSIINESTFEEKFKGCELRKPEILMKTYTGQHVLDFGIMKVDVTNGKDVHELDLHVVKGEGPPLLGRSWLPFVKIDWKRLGDEIHYCKEDKSDTQIQELLVKYCDVFSDQIGTIKDIRAHLSLKDGMSPRFMKARPVPYALQERVNEEIDRMEKNGVLVKVDHSEWATPIVPVIKSDSSVRIRGDFKSTVNPVLNINKYPLHKIEDLFATLAGGQKFSKIDLAHAYQQMEVDADCQKYLTINTPKGLFRYTRLAFGIASAPAIFQAAMDQVLQGLDKVLCHQDDILVTGANDKEHFRNLEQVLKRLQDYGLRVKKQKCTFFVDSVKYLGHVIDRNGLHTSQDKVQAVQDAPRPENVSQLRSFLGAVNYYGRFMRNLSTVLQRLNNLLRKDRKLVWSLQCEAAFNKCKAMIASSEVLCHYDPSRPLRLACDAYSYGLGAVLSHVMSDGLERPIAFASRTLSAAERGYSQIDREALGIIFGVKRFHQYLYGRHFTLITDHRPLTALFGTGKPVPAITAARMQRWALILSAYDYIIEYRASEKHANADVLSRLPLSTTLQNENFHDDVALFYNSQFEQLPLSCADVRNETRRDALLSEVYTAVMNGWSKEHEDNALMKHFYTRRNELSVHMGCVMWGMRVVIPMKMREHVLQELHMGHFGVVKMKSVARSYIWWPGIDSDIEGIAKTCSACQSNQANPSSAPVRPWSWPSRPWHRIHMDFAGPFIGHMFLLITDAYSKWPEIIIMKSTTSAATVKEVRKLFAQFGLPHQLVTDNGPQFVSNEFEAFLKSNGVKHVLSAPYHPATNGQAERLVQSFKQSMRASENSDGNVEKKVAQFLLAYRAAPHCVTNETPAKLFLGRELRTRLDLLKPDIQSVMSTKLLSQSGNMTETRQVDGKVWVRDYRGADKWVPGQVTAQHGERHYDVDVGNGQCRRHIDQLRSREEHNISLQIEPDLPERCAAPTRDSNHASVSCGETSSLEPVLQPTPRRSSRTIRPPDRVNLYLGNI